MRPRNTGISSRTRVMLIATLCGIGALVPALSAAQFDLSQGRTTLSLVTRPTDRTAAIQVVDTDSRATATSSFSLGQHKRGNSIIRHRHRHQQATSYVPFLDLKYGTFDPKGTADGGSFLGFRSGAEFDNRLALAFDFNAYWRSFTEEAVIAQEVDRNGNVITTSMTSFETTSTLIPLGVSLGLRLPGTHTLTPFVGVGVAYEILVNHVEDYTTGVEDTNVYGGPGWQLFGGLMFPVTTNAHLLGELWLNDAEVSRDVDEYSQGLPVRETIDVSGFGARFGVELHFD